MKIRRLSDNKLYRRVVASVVAGSTTTSTCTCTCSNSNSNDSAVVEVEVVAAPAAN